MKKMKMNVHSKVVSLATVSNWLDKERAVREWEGANLTR